VSCPATKFSRDAHDMIGLWLHKMRLHPEWWHTEENRGGTDWGGTPTISFEMFGYIQWMPKEAPIHNGIISWTSNKKIDLKEWNIDKRE
jgi:hypothetical protein